MPRAEIQPCGFLVVLGQDWRVHHVSANIADHFADCGPRMIGQSLSEFFGGSAVHSLRNQLALMRDPEGTARLFSLYFASVPKPFDVSMHFKDGMIILEALPSAHVEAGDPAGMARQLAASLDACETVTDLVQRAAHLLRAVSGFDSVTIFRLDAEGNGERIAEEARGSPIPTLHSPPPEFRIIADAEQLELFRPIAERHHVGHASLAQDVEDGHVLGEADRVVERHQRGCDRDGQVLGARGHCRREQQRRRDVAIR